MMSIELSLEIENSELTGAEKKALVKIRINQGILEISY